MLLWQRENWESWCGRRSLWVRRSIVEGKKSPKLKTAAQSALIHECLSRNALPQQLITIEEIFHVFSPFCIRRCSINTVPWKAFGQGLTKAIVHLGMSGLNHHGNRKKGWERNHFDRKLKAPEHEAKLFCFSVAALSPSHVENQLSRALIKKF